MTDLFLDIRDRNIRAITTENEVIRFQKSYPLKQTESSRQDEYGNQSTRQSEVIKDELKDILNLICLDAGINHGNVHLIIPSSDVQFSTHVLPRMSQQDALKLITRKNDSESHEDSPQINLNPMSLEQNNQTWLAEHITSEILKAYKNNFRETNLKLKTVTTALDATMYAIAPIRESIFNAHAVFEINTHSIEAYYISSSCLLFHESQEINDSSDLAIKHDNERNIKRRMFTILDQLHRINSQFFVSNPMNPLQKVWLCGSDPSISELVSALQDAMDVDTSLLTPGHLDDQITECQFTVLKGLQKAYSAGVVANYMHPDMLRRFPLRKKSGMLIYLASAVLVIGIVVPTEYRHHNLQKQAANEKKKLVIQKAYQSSSAAFAKNLDLLKKLSGSQVLFYPIFREIASNLPNGIYLDSFSHQSKDGRDIVEISATFPQTSDLGTQRTLTRLMESLNQSPYLKRHREPIVISSNSGSKKTMTVKLTCEVSPLDTAK